MCGIGGMFSLGGRPTEGQLKGISNALANRGPDDEGFWWHETLPLAFVHRRLSIIDTSDAGHQPITSACGRYTIVYNGEIYNFRELRARLEGGGLQFRGHCDSEVLTEAISAWGFDKAIENLNGMFAVVGFDRNEQTVFFARDRLGEKPLYFGWNGKYFAFGSQLRVVAGLSPADTKLDRTQLLNYLQYAYVPAPQSIYENIVKLRPGHTLKVSIADLESGVSASELLGRTHCYWNPAQILAQSQAQKVEEHEVLPLVEEQLTRTVESRMVSDVPLGAFLSGGIDSSLIVSLMQKISPTPVKTFSIGSNDPRMNEAHEAKAVAIHLGTDHTELYLAPEDIHDVIGLMPRIYDEPFADYSQLPTYMVSRLARESVTVALSGDAGDEVFSGYNRYMWAPRIWQKMKLLPAPLRKVAANMMSNVSPKRWEDVFSQLGRLPGVSVPRMVGDKLHKVARALRTESQYGLYRSLCTQWENTSGLVIGVEQASVTSPPYWDDHAQSYPQNMMLADMHTYMVDDILTKVDRASMAVGLEVRAPFLDHELIALAMRLPSASLMESGVTKKVLREILYKHVPRTLVDRPKMGFGVPVGMWLRGALRDWAHDLLSEETLRRDGLINPDMVRARLHEHDAGTHNWDDLLWSVLMFQSWLQFERDRGINPV